MRISVLKDREAFDDIVAETLSRFWTQQFESDYRVASSLSPATHGQSAQMWLGNDTLNCIYLPGTPRRAFAPIRCEYGTSRTPWKTPFQRAYVTLATHSATSRWFAHRRLFVTPHVPKTLEQIIVPGNTKIRFTSARDRVTWVVLKSRFDAADFGMEVEHRRMAARAGVPVPAIECFNADHVWLREQTIEGTPANRLANRGQERRVTQQGYASILPLVESSLVSTSMAQYTDNLTNQFNSLLPKLGSVSPAMIRQLRDAVGQLLDESTFTMDELDCSQTHGDFQPGNVLKEGNNLWIIDWEYAGRRMAIYDPLVMGLASRFSTGLAQRIHEYIQRGPQATSGVWPATWPTGFGENRAERAHLAALFLMEELILHVKENAKPPIRVAGQGLYEMLRQVEHFLVMSETR
jgi:hypothetical protein